jgi:hypothetical protein
MKSNIDLSSSHTNSPFYDKDIFFNTLSLDYQISCQLTDNWNLYEQLRETKWQNACRNFEIKLSWIEECIHRYERFYLEKKLEEKAHRELEARNGQWHEEKEQWKKEKLELLHTMQGLQVILA